jgi:aminotransferase EvaB
VFVDVDPATALLDLGGVLAAVTARTKAVVPVHLYGNMVDVEALQRLLVGRGIVVIEDCAQSQGASLRGRQAGTIGDVGAFSFYPTKNLGAYGDGGACWTRDAALATRMRSLRMYGFEQTYYAEREGLNSRLDPLQAAILQVKLPHLGGWVARRQQIAAAYDALLRPDLTRIATTPGCAHGRHLYVLRVADRDAVRAALQERQVMTGVHYPHPIHRMRGYEFLGYGEGSLPHSERLAQEVLSLPLWPELADAEVERVARAVNAVAPTPGTR